MHNKTVWAVVGAALIATIVAIAFGQHEHETREELRSQVVAGELHPIAALLQENLALIQELQSQPFNEKDSGILESYLVRIRRDGVPKNAQMKQRLDQLADNNTAIVTLIQAYSPHARTDAFRTECDKFRNYASAWRDRWNSVMELYMAGGSYVVAEIPFPRQFPDVVQAEIVAVK